MTAERMDMYNPEAEAMPRGELRELQLKLIKRQLRHVNRNSSFFREKFRAAGLNPARIKSIADFQNYVPTMDKDEVRAERERTGDPFGGTLCVPLEKLVEVNRSTGTTGKPNIFGITGRDKRWMEEAFSRMLYGVGFRKGDRSMVQGGSRWHGFVHGVMRGHYKMGIIPYIIPDSTFDMMPSVFQMGPDTDVDVITLGWPELSIKYIRENGLIPKNCFPRLRFTWMAINATASQREIVEETWGVPYRVVGHSGDQYVPTFECDYCYEKNALEHHFPEDLFFVELLHTETHEPVGPGELGELCLTNLWAQATPYIRYRMEDIAFADEEICGCGRTHVRLKFKGRMAWSANVGGVQIFSDEVENVLWRFPETTFQRLQLVRFRSQPQEKLIVRTSHLPVQDEPELTQKLADALRDEFKVPVELELVSEEEIATKGIKFEKCVVKDG